MYFVWILFILSLIWNYILSKRYIFAEDRQGGAYVFSILFLAVFQTLLVYGMMCYGMISYYKITKGAEVTYDISYLAPLPDCESKTKFVAYTYDPKEKDKYSFITLRSNGNSDYHVNLNLSDKQIRIIDKDEQDFRPSFRREILDLLLEER